MWVVAQYPGERYMVLGQFAPAAGRYQLPPRSVERLEKRTSTR